MIGLYIDGQEIALDGSTELEIIQSNPLLCGKESHTYEVEISLAYPQNARCYGHLHRLNVSGRPTGRNARIRIDGHTMIEGEEILISIDHQTAHIQIVSYEELTGSIPDSLLMRDLDLGSLKIPEDVFEIDTTGKYKRPIWPETEFCFFRLLIGNKSVNVFGDDKSTIIAQPYLMEILHRTLRALGYTVSECVLDNDIVARHLVIVNGVETTEYACMMPVNLSVNDFIERIEILFNVRFRLKNSKTISVGWNNHKKEEYIRIPTSDIMDSLKKEWKDSNEEAASIGSYGNLMYKGLSSERVLEDVPPERLDLFEKKIYNTAESAWHEASRMLPEDKKIFVYREPGDGSDWYYIRKEDSRRAITICRLRRVCTDKNPEAKFTEIPLIPVEMVDITLYVDVFEKAHCIPIPRISIKQGEWDTQTTENILKNGYTPTQNEELYVTLSAPDFYRYLEAKTWKWEYMTSNDGYIEYVVLDSHYIHYPALVQAEGTRMPSLALHGSDGIQKNYYSGSQFDSSTVYTIRFLHHMSQPNPKQTFLIGERLFLCRFIKYTVEEGKLSPIAEGEFLPIESV